MIQKGRWTFIYATNTTRVHQSTTCDSEVTVNQPQAVELMQYIPWHVACNAARPDVNFRGVYTFYLYMCVCIYICIYMPYTTKRVWLGYKEGNAQARVL